MNSISKKKTIKIQPIFRYLYPIIESPTFENQQNETSIPSSVCIDDNQTSTPVANIPVANIPVANIPVDNIPVAKPVAQSVLENEAIPRPRIIIPKNPSDEWETIYEVDEETSFIRNSNNNIFKRKCRDCRKIYDCKSKDLHTAKAFRCPKCRNTFLKKSILSSCSIS